MPQQESEIEYLRRIEGLAHVVTAAAMDEGWLAFGDEGQEATTPLRRAVNDLVTNLRFTHYDGDGCLDHD